MDSTNSVPVSDISCGIGLVGTISIEGVGIGGWGVSQPGNLNGSCVHDPVAGVLELQ